jgi:hypothetical protein
MQMPTAKNPRTPLLADSAGSEEDTWVCSAPPLVDVTGLVQWRELVIVWRKSEWTPSTDVSLTANGVKMARGTTHCDYQVRCYGYRCRGVRLRVCDGQNTTRRNRRIGRLRDGHPDDWTRARTCQSSCAIELKAEQTGETYCRWYRVHHWGWRRSSRWMFGPFGWQQIMSQMSLKECSQLELTA